MARERTRRRAGPAAFAAALAVVLGALALSPFGAATPAPTAVGAPPPEVVNFAADAGFSPQVLAQVHGAEPAEGRTTVVVTFAPRDPTLFDAPAPGAPALTPAEIGDRYGLTPPAYASAEQYFAAQGLTVVHAGVDRLSLTVSGPVAAVGRAFGTTLATGTYDGQTVETPLTAPSLPGVLEAEVAGVTGLSSGFDRFTLPLTVEPQTGPSPAQSSGDLITPAIARQIYDASGLYNFTGTAQYASGEQIVLLLWGEGWAPDDLQTFYSQDYPASEFPAVAIHAYPIDGAPLPSANAVDDPSGATQEMTLDLEWSGSFAPGATLDAVYAPDGPESDGYSPSDASMADALHFAVTELSHVAAISMSFGTAESTASGLEAAWTTDLAEAAQEKITLLAATGDTGGDTTDKPVCSGTPQPNYPASDPGVIAVGGTEPTLARNVVGQVTGLASESAWSGSGGGFSTLFTAPSWQEVGSAAAPISASGFRGMPDLAASAADNFVYYNGQPESGAGTSFATPLWAGLVAEMDALHGQPLGFITPRLYYIAAGEPAGTEAQGLVDITSGENCLGSAHVGWDTATGWGSPRAFDLYADLTSTFVNLTVAVAPSPVGPGGSVTIDARLANASTNAPIAGVPVNVVLTADTNFGPCDGTFGTASPTTNGSGQVSVALVVPACYLGSHAIATVAVSSDGLFGSNQTTLGVNLLGYLGFLGPAAQYPEDVVVYVLIMGAATAIGYGLGRNPPRRGTSPPSGPPPGAVQPASAAPGPAPSTSSTPVPPSAPAGSDWVVNPRPPAPAPSPPPGTGSPPSPP